MPDIQRKPNVRKKPEKRVAAIAVGADIEATAPDYPLAAFVDARTPAQLKALADPVRKAIVDLVMDRAATTTELAEALDRPRGTVDHHLKVLANAGFVRVVRTRKVRAMTERYWGRTARTIRFAFSGDDETVFVPFLREALDETTRLAARGEHDLPSTSSLRHARIAPERAQEFIERLDAIALEFSACERSGSTVFALVYAVYPSDQPVLAAPKTEPDVKGKVEVAEEVRQ
jgi:DNA-binding transcriptional ArsR family regulator